ncbi:hypothetical protein ONZ43_g3533 [Nemania bipapillata]|uniref:Uncharacterized protein n=1 Tax=Nemania bipapillata TaxID=110536 RepID=A0ACC2IWI6_9PEZI|nr:hypothetical protein ONZ43_g3533 [Nemania bipapillata]
MHYGVVSLQTCCDKVNAPVLRIPGNTGCEIQFCVVEPVTSSYTQTIHYGYATGSGTAAQTPAPSVTQGTTIGPPIRADQISDASSWSVVRFYDDELPPEEVSAAVVASPAPPSWTSAAADPWAQSSASTTATTLPSSQTTPSSSGRRRATYPIEPARLGFRLWAIAAVVVMAFVVTL